MVAGSIPAAETFCVLTKFFFFNTQINAHGKLWTKAPQRINETPNNGLLSSLEASAEDVSPQQ